MENRVSIISIIIDDNSAAEQVNALLHLFGGYIIGRLGLPYNARGIAIISVVLDAPADITSSLSGKLGMIKGVTTKTVTSKTGA